MKIYSLAIMSADNPVNGFQKAMYKIFGKENVRERKPGCDKNIVISECKEFQPDLLFLQVQSDWIKDRAFIQKIKCECPKIFIMNWTGDIRNGLPEWLTVIGNDVDLTTSVCRSDVRKLNEKGIKSAFMEIGYDPEIYYPAKKNDERNCKYGEIVYCANNYAGQFPLSQIRIEMITFLKKIYGEKFRYYGNGWNPAVRWLNQQEEAEAYRSCKIAINLSNFATYSSDRLLRILGSGAFCLAHDYEGIEDAYLIGEHLDVWKNFDELKTKIDFYLQRDAIGEALAERAHQFVFQFHTFEKMIENIIYLYERNK